MCRTIDTDVLVIGGGLAGCMAAIRASEHGLGVTVLEKSGFARAGSAGAGIDDLWTFVPELMPISVEDLVRENTAVGEGLADQRVAHAFYSETHDRLLDLQSYGVEIFDGEGQLLRPLGAGMHSVPNRVYMVNGRNLKPLLASEVMRRGVAVRDRMMVTSLLRSDSRVSGATAFNVRTGEFAAFSARSVVLATGPVTRLFPTTTGLVGSSWLHPSTTGDGHAMALRAGADLINMEFPMTCIGPKNFVAGSVNCYPSINLVNRFGQAIAFKKRHEDALTDTLRHELAEGRGPIYMDCTHMREEEIQAVEEALANEGRCAVLLAYMRENGIDLRRDMLEWDVYERGIVAGFGGVSIDDSCETTLEGCFAAGDVQGSFQTSIACGALTLGWRAGDTAGRYASEASRHAIRDDEAAAEKQRVLAPLSRGEGLTWQELQGELQTIMTSVGETRTGETLLLGLDRLRKLKGDSVGSLTAANAHELRRGTEVLNLLEVAEVVFHAALARRESRWFHHRSDYPERNDEEWSKWIVVREVDGRIVTTTKSIDYPYGH